MVQNGCVLSAHRDKGAAEPGFFVSATASIYLLGMEGRGGGLLPASQPTSRATWEILRGGYDDEGGFCCFEGCDVGGGLIGWVGLGGLEVGEIDVID